jgi:Fungal specific transcription factor domain
MPVYQQPSSAQKAANLIINAQYESGGARSVSNDLVYLQAMILMAVEAENHGPQAIRSQRFSWLGSAIGLAYSMKIHIPKQQDMASDGDRDSDDKLSRRAWLSLIILDKFHASSTSTPGSIPDSSVVLLPEDQRFFGESTYNLTREYKMFRVTFNLTHTNI